MNIAQKKISGPKHTKKPPKIGNIAAFHFVYEK